VSEEDVASGNKKIPEDYVISTSGEKLIHCEDANVVKL
jgi:hypothetical protein